MNINLKTVLYPISRMLPNLWFFNYLIAAVYFVRANGRIPRGRSAENSAINDFIFHRMIGNEWSLLQQLCVDKQYAKIFAARSADVNVARTVAIYKLGGSASPEAFAAWLQPYIGSRTVAKSTHGSGKVLFLDQPLKERDLHDLYSDANRNFFFTVRETQYKPLERKILVEENVAESGDVNDYKFFCVMGHVLYCQVDIDRFVDHKRAICTVPDFAIVPVKTKFLEIPQYVERPSRLKDMVRIASELSRDFDFVRVDLYVTQGKIYFGEYTFTPGAACDNFSDDNFAIEFRRKVTSMLRNGSAGAVA